MTVTEQEKTGLGNYFVANYPPFSAWQPAHLGAAHAALAAPPRPGTPLGLYLHIPFCRKRCKFCYFRVYTLCPIVPAPPLLSIRAPSPSTNGANGHRQQTMRS